MSGGRGRVVAAGLLVLLAGCLPKGSVTRRDELEADLYAVTVEVATTTEGLALAPFTWKVEGVLAWTFAREFRDGSHGWLVTAESMRTSVVRDGVAVEVPTTLGSLAVELRSFPDGEILAVTGAAPHIGGNGHIEVLDVLWPALSPELPTGRGTDFPPFGTSWPTWAAGGPRLQTRLVATWSAGEDGWSWSGHASGASDYVSVEGAGAGRVLLGEPARVLSHTFRWERTVSTRWPAAAVVQRQVITGALRHVGRAPPTGFDRPPPSQTRGSDLEPLRMSDGRLVRDERIDPASVLPFVLLPGDVGADERAGTRADLLGAATIPAVEPRP